MSTATESLQKMSNLKTNDEEDEKKMLTLKTNDNEDFQIEESIAIQSKTIKNMVEDDCASSVIPLPNVSSKTLTKVIEYLKAHADSSAANDEKELKEFDKKFMDFDVFKDKDMLFDLVMAANYLDISGLLDISCQKVADAIKDMSVEDARAFFGIESDFTPKEEHEIRGENGWVYE